MSRRNRKAECVVCGEPFSPKRRALGYPNCMSCGDVVAAEQRASYCIVPLPKQGYTLVTRKNDLLHLNQKTR